MLPRIFSVQLGAGPSFASGWKADVGPERRATSERRGSASAGPGVHSSTLHLASKEAFFPTFAAHQGPRWLPRYLAHAPVTAPVDASRVDLALATAMALNEAVRAARPGAPTPAVNLPLATPVPSVLGNAPADNVARPPSAASRASSSGASSRTFSTISSGTIRLASLSEVGGSGRRKDDQAPGARWEELMGVLGWAEALGEDSEWPEPNKHKFVPTACLACTYKRR